MSNPDLPLEITCAEVKRQLDADSSLVLLDCREKEEFALVHISKAILHPMSELAARVEELSTYKQQPLIIYCHHGGRSLRVANWLREQGFTNAQSMAGGIDRWAEEIEPGMARY